MSEWISQPAINQFPHGRAGGEEGRGGYDPLSLLLLSFFSSPTHPLTHLSAIHLLQSRQLMYVSTPYFSSFFHAIANK